MTTSSMVDPEKTEEAGQMIKVSVLYPNEEGEKFDMEYYSGSNYTTIQPTVQISEVKI